MGFMKCTCQVHLSLEVAYSGVHPVTAATAHHVELILQVSTAHEYHLFIIGLECMPQGHGSCTLGSMNTIIGTSGGARIRRWGVALNRLRCWPGS